MRLGYTWCSFRCRDDDRYLHYERLFSIKLLKLLSLTNATSHFSLCGKKLRQFSSSLVTSSPTKITGTISSTLIQRPIPSWYRRCPTEASRYFLKISRLGRRNGRWPGGVYANRHRVYWPCTRIWRMTLAFPSRSGGCPQRRRRTPIEKSPMIPHAKMTGGGGG